MESQNTFRNDISTAASESNFYNRLPLYDNFEDFPDGPDFGSKIMPYLNNLGIDPRAYTKQEKVEDFTKYEGKVPSRTQSGVIYYDDKPVLQNIVST